MRKAALIPLLSILVFNSLSFAAVPADELHIALNAEFDTLNPLINTMMTGVMVDDAVLRPLVKLSPQGKPEPVLLKEIPSLENKKLRIIKSAQGDRLEADLEFLDQAQWGDGTPLTCRDLEASWTIGRHDLVATPNREDFRNIETIAIDPKNPKKCRVHLRKATYNFYLNLPRPLPAHLELPVFNKFKSKLQGYEHNSKYLTDIANPGLYNGPFRVSEMKFGSHIIVVRNERFFGEKPYFKKIVFRFILNSTAIEANLLSGNVNMISSAGLSFDQALAFAKKNAQLPYRVQFVPGVMYSHMDINLDHEILKDPEVRKALAHSYNRADMAKSFFEGKQPPALHFATPFDDWYTEDPKIITQYPFSKRKAEGLLTKAGWVRGPDGYRYKNGKKLSLTLSGVTDNKINELIAVYLQNQWKQVGIELSLKTYPARVFFSEILRRRNFELALLTWVSSPNSVDMNSLSSKMIPSKDNGWAGHNRSGWRNTQVDSWLEQASREFDPQKRKTLMHQVLKAYTEELPSLPVYYRANNSVTPKNLKGYEMSGHIFTEFLNVEKWRY